MKCIECGKTLVAIGQSRSNGKGHYDWSSRQYHKKCWLQVQNQRQAQEYVEQIARRAQQETKQIKSCFAKYLEKILE